MPEYFQHCFQTGYCSLYRFYGDGVYLQYHVTIAMRIFRILKDGLIFVVVRLFSLIPT